MNLYEILGILFIHWFADFVLQTDKQAKGKSKEWGPLLEHTFNYSVVWWFLSMGYASITECKEILFFRPCRLFQFALYRCPLVMPIHPL